MENPKHARARRLIPVDLEVDEGEVARRKAFLAFQDGEARALQDLREVARRHADSVIEELYRHFLSFEETRSYFRDTATLDRVKGLQKEYFLRLTEGDYGADYVANRMRIGAAHERVGLAPKWHLAAYSFYLRAIASRLLGELDDPSKAISAFLSLLKVVFLDIELAMDTYMQARESTVRNQQEAIRELSTLVLQLRDQLLLLPIIGAIDADRARLVTDGLLRSIRSSRAKVVVMDVTGVATIDTEVAGHLLRTVTSAELMGASVILTGLSADVAQALGGLGLDLGKLHTVGDLQEGIQEAERLLGYRTVVAPRSDAGTARGSDRDSNWMNGG